MKIVILGSGFIQFEAIEYLYHRDIEVHVLSNKEPEYELESIKHFENIDICDRIKVLQYCKFNSVDFIYSIGSDFAILTAAYVSEKLGLTQFNSLYVVELLQNKKLFRNFLKKYDISEIRFLTAKNISDLSSWNKFPCVIKPVDSQGQRGVSIVKSKDELNERFSLSLSFSKSGEVIIEEFLPGKEISINVFVTDRKITHFYISDRITAKGTNSGIPWRHIFPSTIPKNMVEKALIKSNAIIEKTGIKNGPVYFQMKYWENKIDIIEVTPRLDGCHLWRLILYSLGENLLKLTFDKLIGVTEKSDSVSKNPDKLFIEFKLQKPGEKFIDIKEEALFRLPYYKAGQIVQPQNGIFEKTIMHIKKW